MSLKVNVIAWVKFKLAYLNVAIQHVNCYAMGIPLWNQKAVKLEKKIAVYKTIVHTTLLYGLESLIPYQSQISQLGEFHKSCLPSNDKTESKTCISLLSEILEAWKFLWAISIEISWTYNPNERLQNSKGPHLLPD